MCSVSIARRCAGRAAHQLAGRPANLVARSLVDATGVEPVGLHVVVRLLAILADFSDARLKAKVKLLADAAIAGVKVKRLKAKLTADSEDTACSDAFTIAGMSASDGACVATAASSGKRRRLSSTTYEPTSALPASRRATAMAFLARAT